jgi:hypothetical protein
MIISIASLELKEKSVISSKLLIVSELSIELFISETTLSAFTGKLDKLSDLVLFNRYSSHKLFNLVQSIIGVEVVCEIESILDL